MVHLKVAVSRDLRKVDRTFQNVDVNTRVMAFTNRELETWKLSFETIATASLAVPLEFNRRALERKDLANEQVGLASLRTGAGHEIGDLHAVILDELVTGGRGGIEQRIADRLARTEKHLREHTTGRPITDPAERAKAVGAICGGFFATVLPELVRQGIAVWDRDQAVGKAL